MTLFDGEVSRVTESGIPGLDAYTVWATDAVPQVPVESGDAAAELVDYGVVLSGEMLLDLGNGDPEEHLRPGDCVVQNGTLHAWRNRGSGTCTMAFVIIGGQRAQRTSRELSAPAPVAVHV